MRVTRYVRECCLVACALALPAGLVVAGEPSGNAFDDARHPFTLAPEKNVAVTEQAPPALMSFSRQDIEEGASGGTVGGGSPASAFSFEITYYLYSDYVWRGINLSEFPGEGREKPNHQMTTNMDIDIGVLFGQEPGTYGTFSFGTFFEWFAAQKQLGNGQNLQEVDYALAWSYDIEPLASTFTLGYTFYAFPNASDINTQEWWFGLEHNDAWMWRGLYPDNEDGVLNPSFAFFQDTGVAGGNSIWMEFGLSHDFELMENVVLTPSWTLAIEHDYYRVFALMGSPHKNTWRAANMLWGLDISYDMTGLLQIPEGWGSVALTGSLYFSDALGNAEDNDNIQDEFFGGMAISWSF